VVAVTLPWYGHPDYRHGIQHARRRYQRLLGSTFEAIGFSRINGMEAKQYDA
jgi:hypothetical protein